MCSNPGCSRSTVGPSQSSNDRQVVTGEAAHICAASLGGARFDPKQTPEDRSSIENAIWLCGTCAGLVDKNSGADYPIYKLRHWKQQAEHKALAAQVAPSHPQEFIWDSGFAAISYINVPRLAMWSAGGGLDVDLSVLDDVANLHDLRWGLNRVLHDVRGILNEMSFQAVSIDDIPRISGDFTGATMAFDRQFFTKNGADLPEDGPQKPISTQWTKAPHIHCKIGSWRVVVAYDPKWLTTTTAYAEFRRGNRRFKGIGIVKEVDQAQRLVIISPMVMGTPKPDFDIFGDGG
jgi:hypothetical protein